MILTANLESELCNLIVTSFQLQIALLRKIIRALVGNSLYWIINLVLGFIVAYIILLQHFFCFVLDLALYSNI